MRYGELPERRPESMEHVQTGTGDARELGRICCLQLRNGRAPHAKKVQVTRRLLQLSESKRNRRLVPPSEGNEVRRDGRQKSERADSTDEVGERQIEPDPMEGSSTSDERTELGNYGECVEILKTYH